MSKRTIIISSVVLLFILLIINLCNGRKFYKTYTGNYITIWNDYIIFEKYKGNKPPQDNYIRVIGRYKGSLKMCFKTNDSLFIWRDFDENSLEIGLNPNKHKLEVFYGYDDKQIFDKKTHHEDSLFKAYYCFDSFPEDGNILFPLFSECIGDSVYIRKYKANPHFYKDFVRSRYDENLNK